jgi:hypothetical protein
MVSLVVFDMFVGLSEDDAFEAISFLFLSILGVGLLLLAVAIDVQYYFLLASTSGGGLTLRVIYADLVANSLCLLRIFFCWVRYLFYDLQAELIDLTFHYTETLDGTLLDLGGVGGISGGGVI